jgi:hypothetical protein
MAMVRYTEAMAKYNEWKKDNLLKIECELKLRKAETKEAAIKKADKLEKQAKKLRKQAK